MQPQVQAKPQPPKPADPPKPSRMSLGALVKGRQQRPLRITLFGVEGVGKSTFAAAAPAPVFLGAEDGTAHLDVTRFPSPEDWNDLMEAVRLLETGEHEFKSLVIDTIDWAEPMLWAFICKRDNFPNVESYGYGKGYAAALDEWRNLLAALDRVRDRRGMNIILLAHSWIKPFKNPEGDDFDRYEMKLHPRAAGLIKEWSDAVLFANFETFASKDPKTKRVKGVSTGARIVYTTRSAAYDAKNRCDLPEVLPLSWADFSDAVIARAPATPEALTAEIERKAALLGGDLAAKTLAALARVSGNAAKLAQLNDWTNSKLSEGGLS